MIRPARTSDAAGIAAIWNPIIRDTSITFTTTLKTPEALAVQIADTPVWVAEEAGALLGFITWGPFRGGPGYAATAEHSIHIAAGARGRGIGRALMARAEAEARRTGIDVLIAGLSGENETGIAFHTACGFQKVGHLPGVGQKFGRKHDLVFMQKTL